MRRVIRWSRIAAGFVLLAVGLALLVLPGPGWLTIAAGLALLASEYEWARALLDRFKRMGKVVLRRRTAMSPGGDAHSTEQRENP